MITHVSYKHCICDMCGKTEDIPDTLLRPDGWQKITIYFEYICCKECAGKLYKVLTHREDA